jgi:hypothetical protein
VDADPTKSITDAKARSGMGGIAGLELPRRSHAMNASFGTSNPVVNGGEEMIRCVIEETTGGG